MHHSKVFPRTWSMIGVLLALVLGPRAARAINPLTFHYFEIVREGDQTVDHLATELLHGLVARTIASPAAPVLMIEDRFLIRLRGWNDDEMVAKAVDRADQIMRTSKVLEWTLELKPESWVGLTKVGEDELLAALNRYEARVPAGGYDGQPEISDRWLKDLCEQLILSPHSVEGATRPNTQN